MSTPNSEPSITIRTSRGWTEIDVRCKPLPEGMPFTHRTTAPPFDEIKHLLTDRPLARPGDPWPPKPAGPNPS